jgi:hypothetical protein
LFFTVKMEIVADKSERVNCPFDPVHVIERRRLQAHIIKCKRVSNFWMKFEVFYLNSFVSRTFLQIMTLSNANFGPYITWRSVILKLTMQHVSML